MLPFYFGAAERPLLGVHHQSGAPNPSNTAAVLCHPFGDEYICSHRTMKVLASRLAGAGIPSLRFDYFGTGDSAGDSTEGLPEIWIEDIRLAIDELQATTGADTISVVGLRLGATLAALAAQDQPVSQAVLWEPITDGKSYLDSLLQRHQTWLEEQMSLYRSPIDEDSTDAESLGFPLPDQLKQGITEITLPSTLTGSLPRALVLSSDPVHGPLASLGQVTKPETIDSEAFWCTQPEFDKSLVPIACIETIVEWMTAAQ